MVRAVARLQPRASRRRTKSRKHFHCVTLPYVTGRPNKLPSQSCAIVVARTAIFTASVAGAAACF